MSQLPFWLHRLQEFKPRFRAGASAHPGVRVTQALDISMPVWANAAGDVGGRTAARSAELAEMFLKASGVEMVKRVPFSDVPSCREKGVVIVHGGGEAVRHFLALASEAGRRLPREEYPGLAPEHSHAAWLDFVYTRLREHPGHLVHAAQSEQVHDSDELTVNAYMASVEAIDWATYVASQAAPAPAGNGAGRPDDATAANCLERQGGVWVVTFAGREVRQAPFGLKGWDCLARLLARPHTPIHSLDLEGHAPEVIPRSQNDAEALDAEAGRQYRDRLCQIEAGLREAQGEAERGDRAAAERVARLEMERERIRATLLATRRTGRGRPLSAGNSATAAAGRVKSAIRAVKDAMREKFQMPDLAAHLDKYLRQEGSSWAYRPQPPDTRWHVQP